jgi:sugar phosphate permease
MRSSGTPGFVDRLLQSSKAAGMSSPGYVGSSSRSIAVAFFCAVAAVAYLSRNCLGVFAADDAFRAELNASRQQLSDVMTAFFIAYGVFQIPAAWLGQRFGSRIVLTIYATAWSICTAILGLCGTVGFLTAAMAAIGTAQAGVFPNAARSIADWMPAHRKAIACGFMGAFMSIGGAVASGLTGLLLDFLSWNWIVVAYSTPGLLWAFVFYHWFRDRPEDHPGVNESELAFIRGESLSVLSEASTPDAPASMDTGTTEDQPAVTESTRVNWRGMLTSRALWLINGQQFFRGAGYIFFATWFPTYLRETHLVSVKVAGLLSSLPLLAVVLGCSLGGILTDWLLERTGSRAVSRKLVASLSLAICAALTISALWADGLAMKMTLITAGSFFAAVAGPCSYAQTMDLGGKQISVVFGMMNMMGNFGAAVCPQLVTRTADSTGWENVLFLFFGIYLAAAICWALVDTEATIEPARNSR